MKVSQSIPSILVICINYHNDHETIRFVKEVLAQQGAFQVYVMVVDNTEPSSKQPLLQTFFHTDERVFIHQAEQNLGYFGGAARGLEQFLKSFELPNWIIVCNTDITFSSKNILALLLSHQENPPAVVAPAILSTYTGVDQNPFMIKRPTRFRMHFYKWLFRSYIFLSFYECLSLVKKWITKNLKRININVQFRQVPRKIYAPHGSFMAFSKIYFQKGGNLNYGAFLFGEEIFVAESVRQLGLEIVYDPQIKVHHDEHSAVRLITPRVIAKYKAESAAFCADKFF